MKVTKLEHSALVVESAGRVLIIDPGSLTTPITEPGNTAAIVITHEHPDHWTPEQLARILNKAPGTPIYGPRGVAAAAAEFDVTVVAEGDTVEAGSFTLTFFGAKHAALHPSVPIVDNVGVLVNDALFDPGDALTVPDAKVDTLAVPASAPWLRLGDAMDYVAEVRPARVVPIHDMVLSAAGRALYYGRLQAATEAAGAEFIALDPGESLDI